MLTVKAVLHRIAYLTIILIIMAAFLPAPIAQAKLTRPSFTPKSAVFNNPLGSKSEKYKLIDYMDRAINSAPKGSTIRISMYSMDAQRSADALIKAHKRGVNVRFLTDDHADGSKQMEQVKKALSKQAVAGQTSFFKVCDFSCTSDYTYTDGDGVVKRPYNHSKFIVFSSTSKKSDGDTKMVSMITSTNMTKSQAEEGWNDLYTVVNDEKIYNFLASKFDMMTKDKNTKDPYDDVVSGQYKLYFFPHYENKANDADSDVVMGILDNIKCSGAAEGYGYKDGSTRRTNIRIAMDQWAQTRAYLAEKLWDLNNSGCSVKVVIFRKNTDPTIIKALTKAPTAKGRKAIELRYADYNKSGTSTEHYERYLHSKYFIIDGKYLDDSSAKIVFMGSANWTRAALRYNNEVMLRIWSDSAYKAYLSNFNTIFKHSKTLTNVNPN